MSETVRTVLITGATSGIGLETARRLTRRDTMVILHAPSAEEAELAHEELVKTGSDPLRLATAVADFSRMGEVGELAEKINRDHPRLDVLVNNAATIGPEGRVVTTDGHELTLQVNYLAPYLLTRLLWTALTAGPGGRVVNVSSTLHHAGHLHWGDLDFVKGYARVAAYAQSKLALTMFTRALSEYGHSGPTAVAVHPGIVDTGLMRIYGRVGAPVGEGGAVLAHLAGPRTQVDNGCYYHGLTPGNCAPIVRDRRSVGRLWKLTARMTGLV